MLCGDGLCPVLKPFLRLKTAPSYTAGSALLSNRAVSSLLNKARLLKAYLTGRPIWCTWQVTYACNFRCRFCDYWKEEVNYSPEARRREASLEDFDMAASKLGEIGSLIISMAGGEPFLRPDLAEITAVLARQHFPLITTNGWLVTEQRARKLWEAGLCGISVSLDYAGECKDLGGREAHDVQRGVPGAAERARNAIRILSRTRTRHHQRVNLLCVLNDRNLGDVEELIQFAAENDATFSIQPYCSFKSSKREFTPAPGVSSHLLALKKLHWNFRSSTTYLAGFDEFLKGRGIPECRAGRSFFNIDNLLNVEKCVEYREEPIGNLRNLSADELLDRLRAESRRNSCTACWYGCRGEVEQLYSIRTLLNPLGSEGAP